MNKRRWFKLQRGQALTEYWATIPAGIIIMLAAGGLTQFITKTILTTTEVFKPTGDVSECDVVEEEEDEGPEYAQLACHSVQLVGRSYDEASDQTTVAYKVSSVCDPSISHWVLGLPPGVASKILSSSEAYERYQTDPTTGLAGIKFDTGYESGDGGGGGKKDKSTPTPVPPTVVPPTSTPVPPTATPEPTATPKDKKDKKLVDAIVLVDFSRAPLAVDSRTVILTLGGYYEWGIVEVATKFGTQVAYSEITAPVAPATPDEEDECAM